MKAYVYETFEQLGRIPANIVIPVEGTQGIPSEG